MYPAPGQARGCAPSGASYDASQEPERAARKAAEGDAMGGNRLLVEMLLRTTARLHKSTSRYPFESSRQIS